ncbi:Cupredoxin [Cunninghamella echinulata]|nr:Cupredoxin [Cunninghamella echinulata]
MNTRSINFSVYTLFLFVLILAVINNVEARGKVKDPSCQTNIEHDVLLVNGKYPAPPIRATVNDDIHIIVRNSLGSNETTSIHYHGILQIGSTQYDGVPNVNQKPILPGEEFHQRFKIIDQVGTFFYHGHVGLQEDTIQGPFIVYPDDESWPSDMEDVDRYLELHNNEDDYEINRTAFDKHHEKEDNEKDNGYKLKDGPYEYDDERVIQISEWWNQSSKDRLDYYLGSNYTGMKAADYYLINGRGNINNITAVNNCPGYASIDVLPNKVYRLRLIGAISFTTVSFSIANHNLTIIEVDGNLIEPYETSTIEIASGQRFSVLVNTNQLPGTSYNMDVHRQWAPLDPHSIPYGRAIFNYLGIENKIIYNDDDTEPLEKKIVSTTSKTNLCKGAPKEFSRTTLQPATFVSDFNIPKPVSQWIFPQLKTLDKSPTTPTVATTRDFTSPPDRTIVIMPEEVYTKDHKTRWKINGRFLAQWKTPVLEQLINSNNLQTRLLTNETNQQLIKQDYSSGFDDTLNTYPMFYNEVIDVVIHTTTLLDSGICATHPWHTHGFQHYPIAHGPGEYNHEQDEHIRTYEAPIPRDVSQVYPVPINTTESGVPCGWSKIRVFANNPGMWAFHCHITSHMIQGMMLVVEMAPDRISF